MKIFCLKLGQVFANSLPEKLKWLLWLIYGIPIGFTYTNGVCVAVFNNQREGLAVKKNLGISGVGELTLPGGRKDRGLSAERVAVREVLQETGIQTENLVPISLEDDANGFNMIMLYLSIKNSGKIQIEDFIEIKWAGFVSIDQLRPDHAKLAKKALNKLEELEEIASIYRALDSDIDVP